MKAECARCGEGRPAGARFCPSCGAELEAAPAGERKLATMVFADLVASTELASGRDPEELRDTLARFFAAARSALEEHGGSVEKYVGDAVMAVFGVPRSHGDDPDRAVSAALALVERVAELPEAFRVRVGVATGEVVAVGAGADLAVTGEAVNAAARVQQAAQVGEVLVDARTARACRAAELHDAGQVEAKGFARPIEVFRATGPGHGGRLVRGTPLVGRDEDLALLRLTLARAWRDRVPVLVNLVGDAGVGKTRLTTELLDALAAGADPPRVLAGRNPAYGRGIAFWALGEIVRGAAGVAPDADARAVAAGLRKRLTALGSPDAAELATDLSRIVGGADGRAGAGERVRRAWRRLVGLLAAERPLLILLEDAHWADDGLLDLVDDVTHGLADVPLAVLCTTRPELVERRPEWAGGRSSTAIELRPLGPDGARALARALLPGADEETAGRVAGAAGGNPFFTEEVAQRLAETGHAGGGELPDTVQAAVAARIDLLPDGERRALQRAAVLGERFPRDGLEALLGAEPDEELRALARRELVLERPADGPGAHGFRHQLVREVAYATLPRAERALLHEQAAEWVARTQAGRLTELAELVAFHRARAAELVPGREREEAAVRAAREASAAAWERGATGRAQELRERAAELSGDERERLAELRAAADIAIARFRGGDAVVLLDRAAELAATVGDAAGEAGDRARALEVLLRFMGFTGDPPGVEELRERLERARAAAPPGDAEANALVAMAQALVAEEQAADAGDLGTLGPAASAAAERALGLARGLGDPLLLSAALDVAASAPMFRGDATTGLARSEERRRLIGSFPAGHPRSAFEETDILHMVAETRMRVGDFPGALEAALGYERVAGDCGLHYAAAASPVDPLLALGRWDEALESYARFRAAWEEEGRPQAGYANKTVVRVAGVLGLRGDDEGRAAALAMLPSDRGARRAFLDTWGVYPARTALAIADAELAIHRGDALGAAALIEREPAEVNGWFRPLYAAMRADVLVRAGAPGAADAVAAGEEMPGGDAYAAAVLARARALLEGDREALAAARASLAALGAAYQEARTALDLGGADADAGRASMARLGATAPAD